MPPTALNRTHYTPHTATPPHARTTLHRPERWQLDVYRPKPPKTQVRTLPDERPQCIDKLRLPCSPTTIRPQFRSIPGEALENVGCAEPFPHRAVRSTRRAVQHSQRVRTEKEHRGAECEKRQRTHASCPPDKDSTCGKGAAAPISTIAPSNCTHALSPLHLGAEHPARPPSRGTSPAPELARAAQGGSCLGHKREERVLPSSETHPSTRHRAKVVSADLVPGRTYSAHRVNESEHARRIRTRNHPTRPTPPPVPPPTRPTPTHPTPTHEPPQTPTHSSGRAQLQDRPLHGNHPPVPPLHTNHHKLPHPKARNYRINDYAMAISLRTRSRPASSTRRKKSGSARIPARIPADERGSPRTSGSDRVHIVQSL